MRRKTKCTELAWWREARTGGEHLRARARVALWVDGREDGRGELKNEERDESSQNGGQARASDHIVRVKFDIFLRCRVSE